MVRPLLNATDVKNAIALVVIAIAALGRTALAQPPGLTEVPTPPPAPSDWYGWQLLLADGGALGLGAATGNGDIALGWIGTGAVVHGAHHNYGRAVLSVGMRIGLPLAGVFLGESSARGCTGDLCDLGPALVGGMLGMGTAEVIDLALAKDEPDAALPARSQRWTPVASVRHSGATLGIAARF